jgi:acyl-CoA thioesterase-1
MEILEEQHMRMNYGVGFLPWLVLMVASVGTATGAAPIPEAELHEDVTNAFVNPQKTSKLPKVLIIGDSISIGYTAPVRKNLAGKADVSRPSMNCQHSGTGVQMVKAWMGTTKWDVIHFNFGIWDTHWIDAKGALVRTEADYPPSSGIHIRYTPEQYQENLTQIIKTLKGSGAKLIWASTTPVMYRKGARLEAIPTLNRTAEKLMKANNIAIDDLYSYVMPSVKKWQTADQVHFNALGNDQLGQQVSESILQALKSKK